MGLIVWIKIQPALAGSSNRVYPIGCVGVVCCVHARPSKDTSRIRITKVQRIVPNDSAMEIVENRSIVFQAHRPSVSSILSAELDVIRLVIDRFSEFGNVERARACAKESAKSSAPNVMILPITPGERPPRRGGIANIEPRDAIIKAKIQRMIVGIQPLGYR